MNKLKKFLSLFFQSIINPKKVFFVLNKKLFTVPHLYSLDKIKNKFLKKKYFYLWINLAKKNLKFQKLFFQNEKSEEKIRFDYNKKNDFNENFFKSLASNGIIIIENVLPNNEKTQIQNDFIELKNFNISNLPFDKPNWLIEPIKTVNKSKERVYSKKKISHYPSLEQLSNELTKKISGKILKTEAEFYFDKCIKTPEEKILGDNVLHIDRWVPNFKIIYSPFEVKIDNAPFTYLLESHKINGKYEKMIFNNNFKNIEEFDLYDFKKKIQIILKENSLIVALTNGFHGRSPFTELNERMLLFLQYIKSFNKLSFFNYKSFNK
jgi:hypothetical protein